MKKGFTLIEVLAVIVVIGIIAAIGVPAISEGLKTNSENALKVQKERIIDAAKDWSLENLALLPEEDDGECKVKLSELKKGYISINVKNPDTGNILSDESYVIITNNNGDYSYEVKIYDIPKEIITSTNVNFPLEASTPAEINSGSTVGTYDITVTDSSGNNLKYSKQYILNNNEVGSIDTSKAATYSIIYTVLYNDTIYKSVKTIIVK